MQQIYAMALFALTMSVSPGPVNIITLSTGLNHGVRSALGFVSGATAGFTLLLFLIGIGMSAITESFGWLIDVLSLLGSGLIVFFGYKLLTSDGKLEQDQHSKPSFWQGVALQWLNPKAWGACVGAVGLFGLDQSRSTLYLFTGLYCFICFFGIGSWAWFGSLINRMLSTSTRRVVFNQVLGVTLVLLASFLLYQRFV